jgi:adenylate kinase
MVGPPGSGKGTQGKLLGSIPGFFHHSSGEVFRNLNPASPAGSLFSKYSDRGELVPDAVTIEVWRENIAMRRQAGKYDPARDLLILDGIPRTAAQARLMDQFIRVTAVVLLQCTNENSFIQRLKRRALLENRADDAREDVIRRRFEVYKQETRPILECYDKSLIFPIEADASEARVLHDVLGALLPLIEPEG